MQKTPQHILVRLPNWLGDMVMSVGFIRLLPYYFPGCEISVIVKKGLEGLLPFFPPLQHQFIFSKGDYKGLRGLWRFGSMIRRTQKFDLFFCLPDSFSAAFMGYATGARQRIGYGQEFRNWLLTHTYKKLVDIHRVEAYINLLQQYTKKAPPAIEVKLTHHYKKEGYIVVNVNSEASSRRLPVPKAAEVIRELRQRTTLPIFLIGAPNEQPFVESIYQLLPDVNGINNVAGKTNFPDLISLLARAQFLLTTDSGPAHLANALGTTTIVLFGAGKESQTAPYNKDWNTIVRLGKLPCEPCLKNVCERFEVPQCLMQLSTSDIITKALEKGSSYEHHF